MQAPLRALGGVMMRGSISLPRANHRSTRTRNCSAMATRASGVSSAAGGKRKDY